MWNRSLDVSALLEPHAYLQRDLSSLYILSACALRLLHSAEPPAHHRHLANVCSHPFPFPSKMSFFRCLLQRTSPSVTSESFFPFPVSPAPFYRLSPPASISLQPSCGPFICFRSLRALITVTLVRPSRSPPVEISVPPLSYQLLRLHVLTRESEMVLPTLGVCFADRIR